MKLIKNLSNWSSDLIEIEDRIPLDNWEFLSLEVDNLSFSKKISSDQYIGMSILIDKQYEESLRKKVLNNADYDFLENLLYYGTKYSA
ncbi:MAG: hypothetical protein KC516_01345 [Nanoarchaeota archaeon]|nr:hypothetical protein [Nanoarchaeota archaeon]